MMIKHVIYSYAKKIYRKILKPFSWQLEEKQLEMERMVSIQTFSSWIDQVEIPAKLKISVILATRNRAYVLPRAINSVMGQSYSQWELLVVDDGSTDDTSLILKSFSDPRILTYRISHSGLSAARNYAFNHSTGDIVVYLDDDNIMQKNWLKAVSYAFQHWPDKNVLLSARLIDDLNRAINHKIPSLPYIQFERFDRKKLLRANFADIGTIAHRRNILNLKFDEKIKTMEDWDLLLNLTLKEDPLELPIISIYYTTDCADRLSHQITKMDREYIINKHASRSKKS